jgi:hypothetical protein
MGDSNKFEMPTVRYEGHWNGRKGAPDRVSWELMKYTSVEAVVSHGDVSLDSEKLFRYPFLYLWGDQPFPAWSEQRRLRLNRYLSYGGFLLIDSDGCAGDGFDRSIRRELEQIFPGKPLKRLPQDHTAFKSFYLIPSAVGRIIHKPYLEGIDQDDRTMVLYTRNDLGGAWMRDNFGNYLYPTSPGGDRQREMAFRLGVNIIMYSLCVNYKADQVHIPFIIKRRR